MDPILIQAIRQMLVAQRQAPSKGISLTPDDLEAFMRESTKGKYGYDDATKYLKGINTDIGPRNLGRSAVQGATFNLGDEILGAMGPATGGAVGEGDKEDMRLRDELFKSAHPAADAAAGMAGGVATGLLLPGGGAATVGKAALKGAGYGALYGGLSGVGAGEGTTDRLVRGGVGAGMGGALGAVVPGAVGLWNSMRKPSAIAASRINEAIDNSGGMDPLLKELERMKRLGRGDVAVPSDLSPHMNDAADFAANINPAARIPLRNIHDARQADVPTRLLQDAQDALDQGGVPRNANAEARGAELKQQTRDFANSDAGYAGIEAANPKFDMGEFRDILSKPTMKAAWKQARLAGDLTESDPIDQLLQAITKSNPGLTAAEAKAAAAAVRASAVNDAANQGIDLAANLKKPDTRSVSFSDLQQLKQALHDKSTEAWGRGKGALGSAYGQLEDAIGEGMTKSVPNYPLVDRTYGAHKDLERLVQQGAEWWSKSDSRLLNDRVSQLNPAQLTEFRTGIASELLKQLDNARANPTILNQLQSAGQALQRKLEVIFGSKDVLDQFMEKVNLEKKMGRLGEAVGGSPTSRREAGRDATDALLTAVHGPASAVSSGAHLASKAIKKQAQRAAGAVMGDFFTTQGAPDIEKLLRGWQNRDPELLSPFAARASRALTYGGTQGVGSLFNMF
jgi:hypothetical protein